MVGESKQNVFFIHADVLSFAEFEISEFEISRFDCICTIPVLLDSCSKVGSQENFSHIPELRADDNHDLNDILSGRRFSQNTNLVISQGTK